MSPIAITDFAFRRRRFACDGKIPVDIVGILLVIALVMTNVLTVQERLCGFGDNAIIITGGLVKSRDS